jgi:C4-type Zn-finger protein
MAHSIKLSCPNCKQHTHGFRDVEYDLRGKETVLIFTAFCETCKQEVFTQIGVDTLAEWAARDKFEAPPQDNDFLRKMNIVWNEKVA